MITYNFFIHPSVFQQIHTISLNKPERCHTDTLTPAQQDHFMEQFTRPVYKASLQGTAPEYGQSGYKLTR